MSKEMKLVIGISVTAASLFMFLILLAIFVPLAAERNATPSYTISGMDEGCDRFLEVTETVVSEFLSDDEAAVLFRELQSAARQNDPLLASDVGSILAARNSAEVSEMSKLILRRCLATGAISQSEAEAFAQRVLDSIN